MEGPIGWKKLSNEVAVSSGRISHELGIPSILDANHRVTMTYRFAVCDDKLMSDVSRVSVGDGTVRKLSAMNSDYQFFLKNNADSQDWVIGDVSTNAAQETKLRALSVGFMRVLSQAWTLLGADMNNLIKEIGDESFSILSIRTVNR